MSSGSLHIAQHVRCPAQLAYAYARDPANLPEWAAGVGGDVVVEFVQENDLGVLDHTVVLPDGTSFDNPMRVLPDGDGCEVVFTLRRRPSMTDDDLARDAAAVADDLRSLQRILEAAASA